jgi:hypothetical protein
MKMMMKLPRLAELDVENFQFDLEHDSSSLTTLTGTARSSKNRCTIQPAANRHRKLNSEIKDSKIGALAPHERDIKFFSLSPTIKFQFQSTCCLH